ncbi:unnamed protein product, partial [Candidula unifasciata]
TPCSNCNSVMRSPLKEKIYNAISRAIQDSKPFSDSSNKADGALIVGGRRRNRKKRNKKNGQKKKKTGSLESIKSRLSPKGCRKGDSQDRSPLIAETEDNRPEQKDVEEQEQESADQQRGQAELEVRDTAGGEGQGWQDEEHGLIEADRIQQNTAAVVSETEDLVQLELTTSSSFLRHDLDSQSSPETPWLYSVSKVIQVTHLEPPVQLDDVDLKGEEELTMVKHTADPNGSQVSLQPMQVEGTCATKSEASPLIDKDEGKDDKNSLKGRDSKFKDQQPGLPCCTIL